MMQNMRGIKFFTVVLFVVLIAGFVALLFVDAPIKREQVSIAIEDQAAK